MQQTLPSPAKLNLVLDLVRKREDGYHEVDFIMQELEIRDMVTVETVPKDQAIHISCTDKSVPLNETNTCYAAAQLMQQELQKQNKPVEGVRIHIEKKIPAAGGLGGGSSNAAAVIKALNGMWKLGLSQKKLLDYASRIGSDVPFFILGKTCRAQGRGEIIAPIEACPKMNIAFITPPVKVPEAKTKWIYNAFDVEKVTHHPSVAEMRNAIRKGNPESVASTMANVFETLTLPEYGSVFVLIQEMRRMPGVWNAILAGAGPTVAVACDSEKTVAQLIEPFRARGWAAFGTHTV